MYVYQTHLPVLGGAWASFTQTCLEHECYCQVLRSYTKGKMHVAYMYKLG